MAGVKELPKTDYSTDICLLQTSVNLDKDEKIVTLIVGISVGVMTQYQEEFNYDPDTATQEESDEALKKVAIATAEQVNGYLDGEEEVTVVDVLTVLSEFSNVVDKVKGEEE